MAGFAGLSFLNGLWGGVSALVFMPALPLEWQALLTMVLIAWASGAVSVNGAAMRVFLSYAVPLCVLLALGWLLWGRAETLVNLSVAALIVLFFLVQSTFARDSERMFRASYDMRFENLQLVAELEHQRAIVAAERDRAEAMSKWKSHFLAAASHDLRQPLQALEISTIRLSTSGKTEEVVEHISECVSVLRGLLDGLLNISKLDAGVIVPDMSSFETARLLEQVVRRHLPEAQGKGLALAFSAPPHLHVYSDRVRLGEILDNLVDNAIKYTNAGEVFIEARADGTSVEISVTDTGIGIPPGERSRIFEEFYQLSNPNRDRSMGWGLGLAIVRRLTDLLKIELHLDSMPDHGSTFRLTLAGGEVPRPGPVAGNASAREYPTFAGLRALVVDDEASIRSSLKGLLDDLGCAVDVSSGYAAAVDLFRGRRHDLVIADYRLAGPETGIDLVHRLRELDPDHAAVIMTGDTSPEQIRVLAEADVFVVHKPISGVELIDILRQLTENK